MDKNHAHIRVAHLIDSLAAGGAERMAVLLSASLRAAGCVTWLIVTRNTGPLHSMINTNDHFFWLKKKHALDLISLIRLLHFVRRHDIRILHAHGSSLYWAVLVGRICGCKVVWHDHNGDPNRFGPKRRGMFRLFLKQADAICTVNVTNSNSVQNRMSLEKYPFPKNKIFKINNFTSLEGLVRPDKTRAGDPFTVVCVANLRAPKDHLNLLKAILWLRHQHPLAPLRVYLVGYAPDSNYFDQMERYRVQHELTGVVHWVGGQTSIAPWLAKAHLGVLSSTYEGMPLAVLEYGMAGLPVVCTDVGACRELLDNGRAGLLVPPSSPLALGQAIELLWRDPLLSERFGRRLKHHIQLHYSAQAAVNTLTELYHQLGNDAQ